MKIEQIKTDQVYPYENNPRNNDKAVEAVAQSIEKFGFRQPIVIDKNNVIITGHTRLKAAEKLGLEKVPCIRATDLTDEQIRAYRIADNKVSELSEWDADLLEVELGELEGIDMGWLGFEMDFGMDEEDPFKKPNEEDEKSETNAFEERHRVAKGISIVYEIGFESEEQQARWYAFLRRIKEVYPEHETIASRLMEVIAEWEERYA